MTRNNLKYVFGVIVAKSMGKALPLWNFSHPIPPHPIFLWGE